MAIIMAPETRVTARAADGRAFTHETLPPQYVSGAQLCAALNRQDLPALLGTPADHAETASGGGGWIRFAGGAKIVAPEGNVVLKSYSVKISVSYDHLSVAHSAAFLGRTAQPRTVLGHPAVLYSDRTMSITFNGGGKAGTGPGGIARHLLVARTRRTAVVPSRSPSGARTTCCPMTRRCSTSPKRCCRRSRAGPPADASAEVPAPADVRPARRPW
ncbi:DUF6215 domain-containing protein [Streptomyces sp. RKAG293]|uniref:DUF6215 domain-containing protein n=1 Tax=Streptomyces sp. RKAG293 TaxID=2893403 RepID=UPI0027E403C0|nr:DUF6215 domain-containing protein [Streptomyces sp. RKAG293]